MIRLLFHLLLPGLFLLAGASGATAGAGPHVVDVSSVEAPGFCHLETWTTWRRFGGLANASPACTFERAPKLEVGASLTGVSGDGRWDAVIGPTLKLNIDSDLEGFDWAISGAAQINAGDGSLEGVALTAPVSLMVMDTLRLNANLGWTRDAAAMRRDAAFYGAQIEFYLYPDLMLMAETFRRHGEAAGTQAGLRWTPNQGSVDFDLLIGSGGGLGDRAVTVGLTFRGTPFARR